MLRRALAAGLIALAALPAAAAAKSPAQTREAEAPFWMESPQIRQQIDAAGPRGLSYAEIEALVRLGLAGDENADEPVADPCPTAEPNTEPGSVHTNACITYPAGCTANFLYRAGSTPPGEVSDGRNDFIGTAGHCVDHSGQPVYMDKNGAVARVGEVFKHVNGGPGNDTALVRLDPGQQMDSEMPGVPGAPSGIYTECAGGQAVTWWGHGFGVAVGPGNLGTGADTTWYDRLFTWTGDALPGDSGSGVVLTDSKLAAGDLTHLVVDPRRYATNINAGTRMTNILAWAGNLKLVLADGKTLADAPRSTRCGNANTGKG